MVTRHRWQPWLFLLFLLIPILGLLCYALENARQSFSRIEFVEPNRAVIYSRKIFAVQIEEGTWASFRVDSPTLGANRFGIWSIDRKGAAITLHRFPNLQRYSPVPINGIRRPTIIGRYGVFVDNSELRCIDLTTNVVTDRLSVESWGVPKMQVLGETSLLAVVGSTERLCKIFSIEDGKLVLRKEWSAVDVDLFGKPPKRSLLSLVQQGNAIQSRDPETGEVEWESSLSDLGVTSLSSFQGIWSGYDRLLLTPKQAIRLSDGKPISTNEAPNLAVDRNRHRKLIWNPPSIEWVDTATEEVIWSRKIAVADSRTQARAFTNAWISLNLYPILASNIVAVGTDRGTIEVYDLDDGKLLRVIDPHFVPFCMECAAIASLLLWFAFWIRSSASLHDHAWIDFGVGSILALGYVILRSQWVDDPNWVSRPIYHVGEGIYMSWGFVAICWCVIGRYRWTLRLLPILLIIAVSIGTTAAVVGLDNTRIGEFAVGLAIYLTIALFACLPLRLSKLRFERRDKLHPFDPIDPSLTSRSVPLRDIFLILAVIASLVGLARSIPFFFRYSIPKGMELVAGVELLLLAIGSVLAARLGLWLAMSPRSFVTKFPFALFVLIFVIVACTLLGTTFHPVAVRGWIHWNLLGFFSRVMGTAAVAAWLGFFVYRIRGWELQRAE